MKKILAFAAVAAIGSAMAVESANIVGYNTQDKSGSQYVSMSPAFITAGSEGTFKLSDIVLDGGDATGDNIQVLEPAAATVSATYVYVSAAQAAEWGDASYQGWYNTDMDTSMDDVTFPVGTAFLGNFGTKTVRPTYAGQVVDGAVEMDCTGKQYVMFGNPVPRAITLGEIVMDGGDATGDNVQVLDPADATVSQTYVYVSAAQAAEWGDASYQGWYNTDMDTSMNDVEVGIGDAFLGNFGTKSIKITFPTAL